MRKLGLIVLVGILSSGFGVGGQKQLGQAGVEILAVKSQLRIGERGVHHWDREAGGQQCGAKRRINDPLEFGVDVRGEVPGVGFEILFVPSDPTAPAIITELNHPGAVLRGPFGGAKAFVSPEDFALDDLAVVDGKFFRPGRYLIYAVLLDEEGKIRDFTPDQCPAPGLTVLPAESPTPQSRTKQTGRWKVYPFDPGIHGGGLVSGTDPPSSSQ